jgi:hypothetical protein
MPIGSRPKRREGRGSLTDQSLIEKVAVDAKDGQVCPTAVENLADQTPLERVATKSIDPFVRSNLE